MRLLLTVGARPNFIKVAPLVRELERHNAASENKITFKIIHTGQHYDYSMSQRFFEELAIPKPDQNLNVRIEGRVRQIAQVMTKFEKVCLRHKPDLVVVFGDVNSTLACTLTAVALNIPVAHVEAGLRSNDLTMPEEINRILTDSVAHLLLTPSQDANDNLIREGISAEKIKLVGNIMIDSLAASMQHAKNCSLYNKLALTKNAFIYVTLHRPANVDDKERLSNILAQLAELSSDLPVILPLHPRTAQRMANFGLSLHSETKLLTLEPVSYIESIHLLDNARMVITDSGGIQEESTYLRVPCLTLRDNTERPITTTLGSNKLTNLVNLKSDTKIILRGPLRTGSVPEFWDGLTAQRIVQELANLN